MASADYRLCDNCDSKAFYDASLNYERGGDEAVVQNGRRTAFSIDNLGAWAVLCRECAKTHKAVIVPKDGAQS